jgi:hypothetical protein
MLALTASGCASILGALRTSADLQSAGYQNVSVDISTGTGQSGESVSVIYSRGPTGNDQRDAQHAEKIVWDTFPGRFSAVEIIIQSGGCVGPACTSQSDPIAGATYAQLAAEYGPRPRGLDQASAAGHFALPGWAIGTVVGLALLIVVAAVLILVLILRRRPPGPPAPPGGAPPRWPPGPQPWSNPPGSPPWSNPPGPQPWSNPPGPQPNWPT